MLKCDEDVEGLVSCSKAEHLNNHPVLATVETVGLEAQTAPTVEISI